MVTHTRDILLGKQYVYDSATPAHAHTRISFSCHAHTCDHATRTHVPMCQKLVEANAMFNTSNYYKLGFDDFYSTEATLWTLMIVNKCVEGSMCACVCE